ncbi:MAG: hypothetical protein R3298_04650 [Gammaproteobacteria bacterium]|nr:hypothetical protein [Gammaproteobacteria bacterium]
MEHEGEHAEQVEQRRQRRHALHDEGDRLGLDRVQQPQQRRPERQPPPGCRTAACRRRQPEQQRVEQRAVGGMQRQVDRVVAEGVELSGEVVQREGQQRDRPARGDGRVEDAGQFAGFGRLDVGVEDQVREVVEDERDVERRQVGDDGERRQQQQVERVRKEGPARQGRAGP